MIFSKLYFRNYTKIKKYEIIISKIRDYISLKVHIIPMKSKKQLIRSDYLDILRMYRDDTDIVKILTGIRRCGKSTLLHQLMDEFRQSGIDDSQIIYINTESRLFGDLITYRDLLDYVDGRNVSGRAYILIDEIQMIESWEKAITSFLVDLDADIYITGSNSYLLSTELSTLLSGRYVQIKVYPFSFREYLEFYPPGDGETEESRLYDYIWKGSMPWVDPSADKLKISQQLGALFDSILVKDIMMRTKLRDSEFLISLSKFIFSNIGNITSAESIARYAGGAKSPTIRKYLAALEEAYIICKVPRYDIQGKKLLRSLEKYYVMDTGMRNAVLDMPFDGDASRQMENIVCIELMRRGYSVLVGSYKDSEVDFTATKGAKREYYQVSLSIQSEDTYKREMNSLRRIGDNYPKYVLSMDRMPMNLPDGIIHKNIIDWLLEGRDEF